MIDATPPTDAIRAAGRAISSSSAAYTSAAQRFVASTSHSIDSANARVAPSDEPTTNEPARRPATPTGSSLFNATGNLLLAELQHRANIAFAAKLTH